MHMSDASWVCRQGSIDFTGGGKSFSVGSDAKLMKVRCGKGARK
jgi:hypothetical protein